MPKFFKKDLFSEPRPQKPLVDEEHLLESHLDTPELPSGENMEDYTKKYEEFAPFENIEDYYDNYYNPVKTLLFWKAVSRPFRKKDRSYYTTIIILITLVSLIALLAGEKLLIGVLLALLFLIYVLNFVSPEEVEYKLSTQGITIGEHFYHWYELDSFWFSEKDGFKILNVLTQLRFPGMLIIVIGNVSESDVKRVMARFLPFHEIAPKSQIEKWTESLQKHFPLENPHK